MPDMLEPIRSGRMQNSAESIITGRLDRLLGEYSLACGQAMP
jgi:hypothetical protein